MSAKYEASVNLPRKGDEFAKNTKLSESVIELGAYFPLLILEWMNDQRVHSEMHLVREAVQATKAFSESLDKLVYQIKIGGRAESKEAYWTLIDKYGDVMRAFNVASQPEICEELEARLAETLKLAHELVRYD